MPNEIFVDSFAGGGGASLGIAWATGRAPDIAINHDGDALAMHAANHPDTVHVLEDVWKADLTRLIKGRSVGLLWASPDCKHFSRAKGAKPVEKRIRSLAWIVCRWADQIQPRVIFLENVREFADWGPLVPMLRCRQCEWKGTAGQATLIRVRRKCPRCESLRLTVTEEMIPDASRKGQSFRRFVSRLKNLGYKVEHRNLDAADYGAPTHRKRLFLIARRDGEPIVWPEPTHTSPKKLDDQPLFARLKPYRTAAECIDWSIPCPSIFERKRPLKDATLRRIALGIKRYVLENPSPYIVQTSHSGTTGRGLYVWPLEEPTRTISQTNEFAFVAPTLVPITHHGDRKPIDPNQPLPTITTAHRGEIGLVAPILSKYHGQKANESRCKEMGEPFNTLDTQPRYGLVAAFLAKHFGGEVGIPIDRPASTVTAKDHHSLVAANLVRFNFDDNGVAVNAPLPTVLQNNHAALVYSFLIRYFGTAIGQHVTEPLYTITGKDRFGLVTVMVDGDPYVIVDIGMRMLAPRELARAQGFPDTYLLTGTKTSQVARIGNSVVPHMAKALVEANYCAKEVTCG